MKLFLRYVKGHKKGILLYLFFCVIFAVTFALYHLPLQSVLYPCLLCIAVGVICIAIDFYGVRKKHLMLSDIQELTAAMIDELPSTTNIMEKDYQAIIKALQKEAVGLESINTECYQDMVEYYTVWVHQIKTPIASMRLTLQNQQDAHSRRLQSDLLRIEQYVDMVLTFLRLGSTSTDYVFKEYKIDTLVCQAVKKFSHDFIARKIRLEYEPIEEMIITDEKWFSFVLEQLLSNALKYTSQGSIKIYLAEPKGLCIEDTGIGIAPEDLPRIFEKGYTGYNGRSDKKASGIGLYLCKRICTNLHIDIKAVSEVSKGTIVRLDLSQYQFKKE